MATEIKAEPASARSPMNLDQAASAISSLMSEQAAEEISPSPVDTPDAPQEDPPTEQAAAPDEAPVEQVEAEEQPRMDAEIAEQGEAQDTEEIELDPGQLAALHGLDEDDLSLDEAGAIRIRTKVDGKIAEVPISELKDSYQLAKTSQQRLQKLAEDRKAFDAERTQATEALTQQHQMMANALTAIEQQYAHDWQQVDWKRIREDDPEQYTIKRQDYDDRMRQIAAFKQQVDARQHQAFAEKQEQQQRLWQEGALKLNDAFTSNEYKSAPAWAEPEKQRLVSWMNEQGFGQQDIGNISSHLIFKWARDSMLRKDEQAAAKKAVKKVLKLPKVKAAKPGAKTNERAVAKKTAIGEAKHRQKKSGGDLKSTADLIKQIFNS